MKRCYDCCESFVEKVCQVCEGSGEDPDAPISQRDCDCEVCSGTGMVKWYCPKCFTSDWHDD